jgi:hypothetical protein
VWIEQFCNVECGKMKIAQLKRTAVKAAVIYFCIPLQSFSPLNFAVPRQENAIFCTSARMCPVRGIHIIFVALDSKNLFYVSSFTRYSLKWSRIFLYSSKVFLVASRVLKFFVMKNCVFCCASHCFLARFLLPP